MSPQAVSATAAVASAIFAVIAILNTWLAPRYLARYAERVRRRAEQEAEVAKQKRLIFAELMKARGVQVTRDSVAAFNLIDLVFIDNAKVRDAWAELYSAYSHQPPAPPALTSDKMLSLLRAVAEDIGLGGSFRTADLERYYYPNLLSDEDTAKAYRQRREIMEIERASGEEGRSLFPPRPRAD